MNIIDRLQMEWDALGLEHIPHRTPEEIEREKSSNLVWAYRVGQHLGRELTDAEVFDLMQ